MSLFLPRRKADGKRAREVGRNAKGGTGVSMWMVYRMSRDYHTTRYSLYIPVHGHSVVVIGQTGSAHSESDYHPKHHYEDSLVQRDRWRPQPAASLVW